jgi:ketosteroid isomerase-like protein
MPSTNEGPLTTIERLVEATSAHDLERVVACFADDYALEAPLHPHRSFRGTEQVRRNWTQIFAGVPDITVRVLRAAIDGEIVWTEWEMSGTRRDGDAHLMRGVFIFGISGGLIRSGRMFLEPVDTSGVSMDEAIRTQVAAGARGGK